MHTNSIPVTTSPGVELINAMQYMCGESERHEDILVSADSEYKSALLGHYEDLPGHPALKLFDEMARDDFSYSAPHEFILSSTWPDLTPRHEISAEVVRQGGGEARIGELRERLRRYLAERGGSAFHARWRPWYQKMIEPMVSHLSTLRLTEHLANYFRMGSRNYSLVLSPLIRGGYCVLWSQGQPTCLVGLDWIVEDESDFGRLDEYLLHEYSHAFINPLSNAREEEVSKLAGLFDPLKETMKKYAYGQWPICLNEHIVRAATVRIHARMGNNRLSEDTYGEHKRMGFAYIDTVIDQLLKYEANQDRYGDFASFYPSILSTLGRILAEQHGSHGGREV